MTNNLTITVVTTYTTNPNTGKGKVIAKAQGKQRTIPYNHAKSPAVNHASAVGELLNVLTNERQQAMLRHPSGAGRVRHEASAKRSGQDRWTISL